jgi:hypothetical protein
MQPGAPRGIGRALNIKVRESDPKKQKPAREAGLHFPGLSQSFSAHDS